MVSCLWRGHAVVMNLLKLYLIGSFLEVHPIRKLEVKLIEGKNIKNMDLIGKVDSFVVLHIRQTKDKVKCTKSKKNTFKPVWNENFKIEVMKIFRFKFKSETLQTIHS